MTLVGHRTKRYCIRLVTLQTVCHDLYNMQQYIQGHSGDVEVCSEQTLLN